MIDIWLKIKIKRGLDMRERDAILLGGINPRPRLKDTQFSGDAYFDSVRKQQRDHPQKLSPAELVALKTHEIATAKRAHLPINSGSSQGVTAECLPIETPSVYFYEEKKLAQVATSPGYNAQQQDRWTVGTVSLENLTAEEVIAALRETVLIAGEHFQQKYLECTASMVMTIIHDRSLYSVAVGNCTALAVFYAQDTAVYQRLHRLHTFYREDGEITPTLETEDARIASFRAFNPPINANTTRALGGGAQAQRGLTYVPEVSCFNLPENCTDARLALYTAGLAKVMNEEEIGMVIRSFRMDPTAKVTAPLCTQAIDKFSPENVTVVVSNPLPETRSKATMLLVLDGDGEGSENLVDELQTLLPSLIQVQIKRMLFLKQKLTELQTIEQHKRGGSTDVISRPTCRFFKKTDEQWQAEDVALTALRAALVSFQLTGCFREANNSDGGEITYLSFSDKIADVVMTVKESNPEGFNKHGIFLGNGLICDFCLRLIEEAKLYDEDPLSEPVVASQCAIC
jgi:serine/threonine protein phosphatase PrpC